MANSPHSDGIETFADVLRLETKASRKSYIYPCKYNIQLFAELIVMHS